MRRRLDRARLIAGGAHDPIRCLACDGRAYHYEFAEFPLTHLSRCKTCGLEHRCELQPSKPRPKPPSPAPPWPDPGFPPFWY